MRCDGSWLRLNVPYNATFGRCGTCGGLVGLVWDAPYPRQYANGARPMACEHAAVAA